MLSYIYTYKNILTYIFLAFISAIFIIRSNDKNPGIQRYFSEILPSGTTVVQFNAQPIYPVDIISNKGTGAGTSAYMISLSGRYYLTADTIISGIGTTVDSLIKITSDNVTLDLNNRSLIMTGAADAATIAIQVAACVNNIQILNGKLVYNLTQTIWGSAISITGSLVAPGTGLVLNNILIVGCPTTGITLLNTVNDSYLLNVTCSNCTNTGISIINANNSVIENCKTTYITNSGNANTNGFKSSGAKNIIFKNCIASIITNNSSGSTYGFNISGGSAPIFELCSILFK